MAPDSDTRTSRLRSGFLKTLIFRISPGASRYSGCARAGDAPSANTVNANNKKGVHREVKTVVRSVLIVCFFPNLFLTKPRKTSFRRPRGYGLRLLRGRTHFATP